MQNFNEKHPHVIENVRCRCKICEGSIFKSQKKQDVDAIIHARQTEKHLQVQRRASCRYIGLKRASATMNIKAVQIHQLLKKHLRQRINRGYRYIRSQKSKSFITLPISITAHRKARKRLCNPANWSRACPTKLPQECIVFFLLGAVVN